MTLDEKIQKISDHWFEQAQEDLETAEAIFRQAKRNAAALFFLHLASEKLLKSKVVQITKTHAPFTHNLVVLAEKTGWEIDSHILAILSDVSEFNLSGRYPQEKDQFKLKATHEFTELSFQRVKELWDWISLKSELKPS